MNDCDVTVVIVSWNTREVLRDCLRSLREGAGNVSADIVVVDNASTDGSLEMVRREFGEVRAIANSSNRGFAAANNQGMAVAAGRYVLLLNSDTIVLDGAVQNAVAFADAHPDAAVIGCRVLNPDRSLQPTCFMYPSVLNLLLSTTYLNKLFACSRFFGRERMTWWDRDDVRDVEVVTGCFMLVRREAIDQVGMMDEAFFMYCEETDWCFRFRRAGWKVVFTPVASIIHLGGQSSKVVRKKMLIEQRISILRFFRKHHSGWKFRVACILMAVSAMVRLPFWICAVLVQGPERTAAREMIGMYKASVKLSLSRLFSA